MRRELVARVPPSPSGASAALRCPSRARRRRTSRLAHWGWECHRASRPRLLLAGALAGLALACGEPPGLEPVQWPLVPPTTSEWRLRQADWATLRAAHTPQQPYTMRLGLELHEPITGRRLSARGAVAVEPGSDALRMILLGPGGTTALDLWSCGSEYRFALPPIGLVRRGDSAAAPDADRGLPVGFLRWWLLEPLAGRLLYAARLEGSERFVLSRAGAVLDVQRHPDGSLTVLRTLGGATERVSSTGSPCPQVSYREPSTGLDIRVTCEGLDLEHPPRAAAFDDPDDSSRACLGGQGATP